MNEQISDTIEKKNTLKSLNIKELTNQTSTSETLQQNSDFNKSIERFATAAINSNFVFITVILTCFLILVFSIGLIIVNMNISNLFFQTYFILNWKTFRR